MNILHAWKAHSHDYITYSYFDLLAETFITDMSTYYELVLSVKICFSVREKKEYQPVMN